MNDLTDYDAAVFSEKVFGKNPTLTFKMNKKAPACYSKPQGCVLADINNGQYEEYQQPTEKERVLAALNDVLSELQNLEAAKKIIQTSLVQKEIFEIV